MYAHINTIAAVLSNAATLNPFDGTVGMIHEIATFSVLHSLSSLARIAASFATLPRNSARIYAVGGEGTRRLTAALEQANIHVEPQSSTAPMSALARCVKTGVPVWLLASGPSTSLCVRALSEAARLRVPLRVLVLSHGEDEGETLPADDKTDLSGFYQANYPLWQASSAVDCAKLVRALSGTNFSGAPAVVSMQFRTSALSYVTQTPDTDTGSALDPISLCGETNNPRWIFIASHAAADAGFALAANSQAAGVSICAVNVRRAWPFPAEQLRGVVSSGATVLVHDAGFTAEGASSFSAHVLAALSSSAAPAISIEVAGGDGRYNWWHERLTNLTESASEVLVEHQVWIVAEPRFKMQTLERVMAVLSRASLSASAEAVQAERAVIRWQGKSTNKIGTGSLLVLNVPGLSVGLLVELAPPNAVCETLPSNQGDPLSAAERILHWIANTLPTEKAATIEHTRKNHGDF